MPLRWAPITLTFSADRDCDCCRIVCLDPDGDDLMGLPEMLRDLALALGMNIGTLFLSLAPGAEPGLGVMEARGLWGRLPGLGRPKSLSYAESPVPD